MALGDNENKSAIHTIAKFGEQILLYVKIVIMFGKLILLFKFTVLQYETLSKKNMWMRR